MVVVGRVHAVQLGQGPEARPPVAQEVVVQVGPRGRGPRRAQAAGEGAGALVAVDVQRVVGAAVPVLVRLVLLHLDHHGHVALAGGGRRLEVEGEGLLHHGVEGRVGVGVEVGVRVAEQGAVADQRILLVSFPHHEEDHDD
ncbi:hypothetical protein EYF80_057000 [Liparis tanakae]|uniref:Uncharacterized protein n=1 Tax=Liparis tanakae TaxID=230148 RepID=A0A4Z2EVH0_9TELE|nr:hypothetical protein EYF80_057000 [Liparis tanakae]